MLTLALTEYYFGENAIQGGYRIHGGGFAGTILVIIEKKSAAKYIDFIENIMGVDSVKTLQVQNKGVHSI